MWCVHVYLFGAVLRAAPQRGLQRGDLKHVIQPTTLGVGREVGLWQRRHRERVLEVHEHLLQQDDVVVDLTAIPPATPSTRTSAFPRVPSMPHANRDAW